MITFTELLERAKTEEIAIHTPTEKQAKALLKALDEKGYEWFSGNKLTTITRYENHKENTCYDFSIGIDGKLVFKKVMYSSLSFYQEEGYTIIEFSDINFKESNL